jgi:hypothetical protein
MTDTATNFELDILLAKVEKMWRRANHPNTPPAEKAVAEAKALSLMAQHRIEMAMLNIEQADELADHEYGVLKGAYGLLHASLISEVAQAYDCRVWWRSSGMTYNVRISGFRSDFERVRRLANFLLTDAVAQSCEFKSRSIAVTKDYRRSFVAGYTQEIGRRLRESVTFARAAAVAHAADNGSTVEAAEERVVGAELVLVERKKAVADFMKTKRLRTVGHSTGRSSNGRSNGAIAARNADLSGGRNRVGGGTKALGR